MKDEQKQDILVEATPPKRKKHHSQKKKRPRKKEGRKECHRKATRFPLEGLG